MLDIGEIGTAAEEAPAIEFAEALDHCGTAGEDFSTLACDPLTEVLHTPERADLAKLAWADCDSIEEFLDLGQKTTIGDDGSDAVSGQAVGFREGIELDQRACPIGVSEQVVRCASPAVEVTVGFIDDKRNAGVPSGKKPAG